MEKGYNDIMDIHIILTGGTIGSVPNEQGILSNGGDSQSSLLTNFLFKEYPLYKELVSFELSMPISVLSENMTLTNLNTLSDYIKELDIDHKDGIILTHGTDTAAYTANLLSLCLYGIGTPIFIVSSSKPLSDPKANGYQNFNKAVETIIQGIKPGVYVPYKNEDNIMNMYKAERLIQCQDLSPDFECSHEKLNIVESIIKNLSNEIGINKDIPLINQLKELKGNILTIYPQPGLNYSNYDLDYVDAVLHRTYHSSTLPVTDEKNHSVLNMIDSCKRKNVPFYFSPILENSNKVYETTDQIIKRGAIPLFNMTLEMSYIYLLLKYSSWSIM